ncbi:MAG: L,D-transpeptidase [Phototrophicales bacterium]|nr:L,D-transpeptidase [Phototrophicales bacterium]
MLRKFTVMAICLVLSFIVSVTLVAQESNADLDADYAVPDELVLNYVPAGIEELLFSRNALYRIDYRQVITEVNVLDAPNGNILYHRALAEYYVSLIGIEGDWAQINPGEWIPASSLGPAYYSRLGGILFREGDTMEYPMGWNRRIVFISTAPGVAPREANDNALPKYEMLTFFARIEVDGVEWVQIGVDQWLPADAVNVIEPIEMPETVDSAVWVAVDVANQVVMAYEGDKLVFATLTATGEPWSPTEPGTFHVYAQFDPRLMTRGNPNDTWFYYMEDVPYTFYFNGDRALHGAFWHDNFGVVQSHGCVNMSLTAANWIYRWGRNYMDNRADDEPPMVVFVYDKNLPDWGLIPAETEA